MKRGLWTIIALLVLAAIPIVAGVIGYGFDRGWRINMAAVAQPLFDQQPGPTGRLPVFHIALSEASLAELNADLPTSGSNKQPATFTAQGVAYPCEFRYRGLLATTHYGGKKKSFRISFGKDSPFGVSRQMNFINPKSYNMINNHMALRIGKSMGVATPQDQLAYVMLNDRPYGICEQVEQVDGYFEQQRGLWNAPVPVFKGDYAAKDDTIRTTDLLWSDASLWEYRSKANETPARQQLTQLITLLDPATPRQQQWDELPNLINVDAYLRYYACLMVLNTKHIDNKHNHWLVQNPRTGKFYPVLWDPLMLYPFPEYAFYPVHDALSFVLLQHPEWRFQRDQYVWNFLQHERETQAILTEMSALLDNIRPVVYSDPNKTGVITDNLQDVFGYSNVHFESSARHLQLKTGWWFDKLEAEFDTVACAHQQTDNMLHFQLEGRVPVDVALHVDTTTMSDSLQLVDNHAHLPYPFELQNNVVRFRVYPEIAHVDGASANPFASYRWLESVPTSRNYRFEGAHIARVEITNALTGERVN